MPPLYTFQCKTCSAEFEQLMGYNEKPYCPNCEGKDCVKLPTAHGSYAIKGDNSASTRPKGGGR